jgi:hypothetical protein
LCDASHKKQKATIFFSQAKQELATMTDIERVEAEANATKEPKASKNKPWYQGYNSYWATTLSTSFMSILSTVRVAWFGLDL